MEDHLWLSALALVLMLTGLIGTLLPVLPGTVLIFAGAWLAAWSDDYRRVGAWILVLLGILMLIGFAIDFFASMLGAKRVGASGEAIWGSLIGGIAGLFFGFAGLVFGPFIGALAGEWIARQHVPQALRVGLGTWLGLLLGTLAKFLLALTMIGVFALAYWI